MLSTETQKFHAAKLWTLLNIDAWHDIVVFDEDVTRTTVDKKCVYDVATAPCLR